MPATAGSWSPAWPEESLHWPNWALYAWICLTLARTPDAFLALLDGQPWPAHELDAEVLRWCRKWDVL